MQEKIKEMKRKLPKVKCVCVCVRAVLVENIAVGMLASPAGSYSEHFLRPYVV